MFELFKPDFEAILLGVRELPPFQAILKKWAHYTSVILWVPIDQVISASQRTQGNKGRKGISLHKLLIYHFNKLICPKTSVSQDCSMTSFYAASALSSGQHIEDIHKLLLPCKLFYVFSKSLEITMVYRIFQDSIKVLKEKKTLRFWHVENFIKSSVGIIAIACRKFLLSHSIQRNR